MSVRYLSSLILLAVAVALPADAAARPFAPPAGKVYAGVSDTGQSSDFREYRDAVRAHPAVMQSFESWGYVPKEALRRWPDTRTRGMISLSTARCWGCEGVISPRSIARGRGDRYLLALSRALADRRKPTYIRLFPEMNGHWNAYSAFNADGSRRGRANSTKQFRRAWRRIALIVRGGRRARVNRKLRRLGMPRIRARSRKRLPTPPVAFAWVPQATGSPALRANRPRAYFPGYRYVDWVGADVYGKFPSLDGLTKIYRNFPRRPFMVGEWSPWDQDDPGFVRALFRWIEDRGRAKMVVYYQDFGEGLANPFEITDYPQALVSLRRRLNDAAYLPFTPENER